MKSTEQQSEKAQKLEVHCIEAQNSEEDNQPCSPEQSGVQQAKSFESDAVTHADTVNGDEESIFRIKDAERCVELSSSAFRKVDSQRSPTTPTRRRSPHSISESKRDSPLLSSNQGDSIVKEQFMQMVYIAIFGIFGTTLRVYCGRFFGLDCEFPEIVDDFLSPVSQRICATASGRSSNYGGAVFTDLPGNVIGSFIMGMMTSNSPDISPAFPFLRPGAQPNQLFHQAITVGFCGCLTTFAAWNGQMVIMLDPSTELGSQPTSAVFGYFIGLVLCAGGFFMGGKCFTYFSRCRNPSAIMHEGWVDFDPEDFEDTQEKGAHTLTSGCVLGPLGFLCSWYTIPFYMAVMLMSALLVSDFALHNQFYRSMWITALLCPPGALLRWKMSAWNSKSPFSQMKWFPFGTFMANLIAAILFILLSAIQVRFLPRGEEEYPWMVPILNGLRTGFAGSLSTVSTLAKEIVFLFQKYPDHAKSCYYCFATILMPMTCCLLIYTPLIRAP